MRNPVSFELFIPQVKPGDIYKYEIKLRDGLTYLKADPFANAAQLRPDTASVVANLKRYRCRTGSGCAPGKTCKKKTGRCIFMRCTWGHFARPQDDRPFCNYREIAVKLAEYVKEMGYTHVELMPVMEHPLDESWGYQVTGYYAPTSRYGTPEDFMAFVDHMHREGIGVILDWVPAHFPKDDFGLSSFDGTGLFEHQDPRQGIHPHWGTKIFNYGVHRSAIFSSPTPCSGRTSIMWTASAWMRWLPCCIWTTEDGMENGSANIYGGNENLEAVEFLKHLNP